MKKIAPHDLIAMDEFAGDIPLRIDLVYAKPQHPDNIFKSAIYHAGARLWLHRSLAAITMLAARNCYETSGFVFVLKDGLRTTDAQTAMQQTDIVKANPHWCKDGPNRLLSPPGKGGHPRGMAIDIVLETQDGQEIDMGTPFDYLTPDPANNPAHRDFTDLPEQALKNRGVLEYAMISAAQSLGHELLPLPSEWWDFRFPREIYDQYEPLSDNDLLPGQKMTRP